MGNAGLLTGRTTEDRACDTRWHQETQYQNCPIGTVVHQEGPILMVGDDTVRLEAQYPTGVPFLKRLCSCPAARFKPGCTQLCDGAGAGHWKKTKWGLASGTWVCESPE